VPAALLDTALSFLGLRTIPDRGSDAKTSETRLTSANDARRLLRSCLQEDAPRALERALVKGCVDGNPPYDDQRRRAEGRGWECNLNFMKGRAIMNRTAVPYYNLFARVDYFADCRTAYQVDHPDHEQWSTAISLRFHNMLKRWKPGFNWGVQQISFWMRLHGIGFALPEKDHDWRFRSVETGNVLAPKGSPSCLDKRVPYIFVRVPYRVLELWEKIKDEATAKAAGWNIQATRNAIKFGMKGMSGTPNNDWQSQPWEHYQRILTNSELTASFTDGDVVNCDVMLLLENTGKISKFIFTEFEVSGRETPVAPGVSPAVPPSSALSPAASGFLFADPNCYDEYQQGIVPFFRNTGDGTWHSVRGYAMEAFKHLEVENRLLCQGINRAFLNSCVPMQFTSERARTMSQLQVQGTVVKLPVGGEFKPIYIQGGIEDVVLMGRLLGNHLDNNLGVAAPRSIAREDGRGEVPTARQVDYVAANEASISEGEITIYYEQLDSLYQMIYDRASDPSTSDDEAKRFQRECQEDGVPKEAIADMEYVRANRQNGYGSPEMGMLKLGQMKDYVAMLPEDGKQNYLEDVVTMISGPEKTKRYAPRQHVPDEQDWQAAVENEMFRNGIVPPLVGNDVIHLQSHITDAKQFLAPFSDAAESSLPGAKGPAPADLEKPLIYVQAAGQNIQAHLARLQQDPTRRKEAQLFNDEFQNLISFSGKLFVAYRRAQRQQKIEAEQNQSATALTALDQAKVASVQTGTALAAQKTQSQIENQKAKTVQGMAIKEAKTNQELRLTARKHAIEIPAEIVR
jgi:hypothetical protein